MSITRHEVPLVYFKCTIFFTTFPNFQTLQFNPHNLYDSIWSPDLSNKYVSMFLTSRYKTAETTRSYVQTNLFPNKELKRDEASYS